MACKRVKLEPRVNLLELPVELMVPGILQYLKLEDILNFRCCSRYCKELAESALARHRRIDLCSSKKPGTESLFGVIIQHCRSIRQIKLMFLDWLTDEMLIQLFNKNPFLEVVYLCGCDSLTPKSLYPLAGNCKNLNTLILTLGACDDEFLRMLNQHEIYLVRVALWGIQGLSEEAVCSFFRNQPRLEYIALPSLNLMFGETLETIAKFCPDLWEMGFEDYSEYDAEVLTKFLRTSYKVKDICFQIDDSTLYRLSDSFWNLLTERKVKTDIDEDLFHITINHHGYIVN